MSQINSNIKDDSQVVLLLSCFVGHPVFRASVRHSEGPVANNETGFLLCNRLVIY